MPTTMASRVAGADFWDSRGDPLNKINADKVPYIDRASLEEVAGNYLALPYRAQATDRILIKVLIAMELYAFGNLMINEKNIWVVPLSRH
jgi:hypothetical protein